VPVFFGCSRLEVNAGLAGKTGQPGQDIRELALEFPGAARFHSLPGVANRPRQFTDFLSEPAECAVNPASRVFGEVYPLNQFLEFPDLHSPIILKKHPVSSTQCNQRAKSKS